MESMRWRPVAVERDAVSSFAEAELSDRQRIALLLEAAATLATLRRQGLDLVHGARAGVDDSGRLAGLTVGEELTGWTAQSVLRGLLRQLFGDGALAGRGEARRVARRLDERWSDDLTPLEPTRLVSDILRLAPFLWQSQYAHYRHSLVPDPAPGQSPRVEAPRPIEERLLAADESAVALRGRLASDRGRRSWEGDWTSASDPHRWLAAGRHYEAVRVWDQNPPASSKDRLHFAEALAHLGRFESALEAVHALRSRRARRLRAQCLFYLGRLAAAHKVLSRLSQETLAGSELLEVARLAVRIEANRGSNESGERWVERVRRSGKGPIRLGGLLLAAEAAWDRGKAEEMEKLLTESQDLRDDPREGWRWLQAQAMLGMAQRRGDLVVESVSTALRRYRRDLPRPVAAGLWNDLAVGRWQSGDLSGAERACGHASRLYGRCEGPRRSLLSQRNLAELRLRRGRLLGVREILETALARNRQDGNVRSTAEDATLWARWELVHGRSTAAIRVCDEALDALQQAGCDWHQSELQVLAARALGWLGRAEEAALRLEGHEGAIPDLEPEEHAALWALAGDRERALAAAGAGGIGDLWRAALTGSLPLATSWEDFERLEPYRAARLVWDLELVSPGWVEVGRRRRAVADLRRVGATRLAARLESRVAGPWEALATFLAEAKPTEGAIHRLFSETGTLPVRLVRIRGVEEQVLIEGPRAACELMAPLPEGVLRLEMSTIDSLARAQFRAVWRRLRGDEVVERALPEPAADRVAGLPGLVGSSPTLLRALDPLPRLAQAAMPLLVLGESGTGKELVAQQVHELSPRSNGPFIAFNCAAISEQLVLSDLFGHVRGAFTGADRDRMGIFESARGGTVFLDEIGDLPPSAQGMLLRVLQEGEIRRIGETLPRKVDVRVVAATHHAVLEMVERGEFRRDLYYRLRVAEVVLPPLRDRGQDVLVLARHFLCSWGHGGGLSREVARRLSDHDWPGNVRELRNVLEVAVALAGPDAMLRLEHLQLSAPDPSVDDEERSPYQQQVITFRKDLIESALARTEGNQAAAARRLGLTRQALTYNIRALGIVVPGRGTRRPRSTSED